MGDVRHPPMEKLQDLEYCIDSKPPWPETVLLAFQNYILMLGRTVMIPTVLVPLMGGNAVINYSLQLRHLLCPFLDTW
ncbi:nucleobase-ascorbate transporter 1-like isoform X1 [Phalaenopsis equestris]|uniref:nucleobase-ascorbate transporter 1-like isoform X1 n=1 Tax=Phalaenopsis equestris TaxID=78828 RepID=UPI0009E1F988|nr:nucleobase-ascorbate transporter 1-like isoform X1 [Phalaenopsis equestris]